MSTFDLFALRNSFEDQGVMIVFNGPFSHSVIEELGEAVKKYLQSAEAPKDRVADVFSVFVEQAQNLKNYTSKAAADLPEGSIDQNGTLAIARDNDHYVVSSGNVIRREDVEAIRGRLDSIVELDAGELKKLYKQRLREPTDGSGGAGLGFISMARKATAPIEYTIRELQDGTAFFNITVTI